MEIDEQLATAINQLDRASLKQTFDRQHEVIFIEDFFPAELITPYQEMVRDAQPLVHRNFIPGYKKGGSVSRYTLDTLSPLAGQIYRCPALWQFLEHLSGETLLDCPASDPHAYALYSYTELGDHVGWHYDTSYYKGRRYTLLLGVIDDSSSQLETVLYRTDPNREPKPVNISLRPGMMVFFNGDALWHRVTPLGENEERIILTFEYVTSREMQAFRRFVSNMKDSIAYFGFKQVFSQQDQHKQKKAEQNK